MDVNAMIGRKAHISYLDNPIVGYHVVHSNLSYLDQTYYEMMDVYSKNYTNRMMFVKN
jgi:hypothetical protein